jgi:hypothetical protein
VCAPCARAIHVCVGREGEETYYTYSQHHRAATKRKRSGPAPGQKGTHTKKRKKLEWLRTISDEHQRRHDASTRCGLPPQS